MRMNIQGDTKSIDLSMSDSTLLFEDCLFDFSFQTVPPPQGQEIMQALLSQTESTLALP